MRSHAGKPCSCNSCALCQAIRQGFGKLRGTGSSERHGCSCILRLLDHVLFASLKKGTFAYGMNMAPVCTLSTCIVAGLLTLAHICTLTEAHICTHA